LRLDLFGDRISISPMRPIALVLLGVLAFLALALFSPLHQHESNGHCTFNDFEQVVASQAENVAPSLELTILAWQEHEVHERSATRFLSATLFQRGPPTNL
jgi:hypothetical protein